MEHQRSNYAESYLRPESSGAAYDRGVGNRFELAIHEMERRILSEIHERHFRSDPDIRYLDFACGTGRILAVFADRIRRKVGIDTSTGQIASARKKVPDADLIVGNILTDPGIARDKDFQLVTCFRLFLNLEPELRLPILRQLYRVLDDDGYLVADNHMNRYSVLGLAAFFTRKVLRFPRKADAAPGQRGIIGTMSEFEFKKILRQAGFEVKRIYRLSILPGHGPIVLLPVKWLLWVERRLSRVPLLNLLSKNQIYACCRRPEATR